MTTTALIPDLLAAPRNGKFDPLRTLGGTRNNVGPWRQCREPRPLHDLPDGRGHRAQMAEVTVPRQRFQETPM